MSKIPNVVTIGGGTGSYASLMGLKKYPIKLTAIVNMIDNGGSSGRLRDELGVLPPGDVRQCLVALAESSRLLRELFSYRFEEGGLRGHSFGNIFLSTLEKQTGSMKKAIAEIGKILRIKGQVVPVTFTKSNLCVDLTDGKTIIGETHIDVLEKKEKRAKIVKAYLSPVAKINQDAKTAILYADYILIGPGDLYTSIIPNLLINGLPVAIKKSKAKKIYVLNLMTKYGQTTNYKASEHVKVLERYLGKNVLDFILVNSKNPKKKALSWYEEYGEHPVEDNLKSTNYKIIRKDLIKDVMVTKDKSDELRRSIIRHDSKKLASEVMNLIS
ncbi:MAG: gluconeogenesis factor YvcK family protein [Patescibacteria group bacterium]